MHDAELHGGVWEYALDGIWKAFQTIHAAYHDIIHATVVQVCKHLQPEVCSLTLCNIHAEQFLLTTSVDAKHIVDGTVTARPLSSLTL